MRSELESELERQRQRNRRLAEDKSYLQLIIRLMEQLNPLPGIDAMITGLLNSIVETIGGTNIRLWYWVGDEIHYTDFLNGARTMHEIDDPLARQAAESRQFVEVSRDADAALLRNGVIPGAWNWAFPLLAGKELIGVILVENLHISGKRLRNYLPVFFSHVALILSSEVRNTLRLRAESQLREKSEELDRYFNTTLDLFCISDLQGRLRKLNPAWSETLGYELHELEGRRFIDLVHPDDIEATLATSETASKRDITAFTNRYRHKDGSYRWIEWRSRPQGDLVYAVARDVTDRKRIESELADHQRHLEEMVAERTAALRDTETRYRMVADFTYAWETWIDQDGTWIYCSPSCKRLTGRDANEFMDDPGLFLEIIHPEDRAAMAAHLSASEQAKNAPEAMVFRIPAPDGKTRWVEHICQSIFDAEGHYLGRRASNRDITDRLEAVTAMRQAKEAAEAANQAKSIFLASMSHELRTPLNAILGFAQLMQRAPNLTPEQQENLSIIHRSGDHLLALINDVLEISRIEAGRERLIEQPFDLNELLSELEESVRLRIQSKPIRFNLEAGREIPKYLKGDERKLRQILLNLLSNAEKFTDRGHITLRVGVEALDETRVTLSFAVEDTGIGIAEGEQALIFEAFSQAEQGERRGEGTGLGLAISREYVALLGGELVAESVLETGSTFRFEIPLKIVPPSEVPKRRPQQKVVGLEPGQSEFRLLIAEDMKDNRVLLRKILSEVGFQVREAIDGREAVAEFKSWRPHLIWMDMRMPEMDGYEATRRIKATAEGQKTPIVALTASAFEEDREAVMAAGCDGFVRKPLQESEIFETLEKLLGVRFLYADAEAPPSTNRRLESGDLASLPPEQRELLLEASLKLDLQAFRHIVDEIARHSTALSETLQTLGEEFRFDLVIEALHQIKRDSSTEAATPVAREED